MYLIFDTEATGLPRNWGLNYTHSDNWPRVIQIAWQLHDELGNLVEARDYIIKPSGFKIPYDVVQTFGISNELALAQGISLPSVLELFESVVKKAKFIVGHNVKLDINLMLAEYYRLNPKTISILRDKPILDTCSAKTTNLCKVPGGRDGRFKLPQISELNQYLFGTPFIWAGNLTSDVEAIARCFFELIRKGFFDLYELKQSEGYFQRFQAKNPTKIKPVGLKHVNLKKPAIAVKKKTPTKEKIKVAGLLTYVRIYS